MSENKKLVIFDFSGVLVNTSLPSEKNIPTVFCEMVRKLSEKYKLVIVSSMPKEAIIEVLEAESIMNLFSDIHGFKLLRTKKSKIKEILEEMEISPKGAVMVTDTLGDLSEVSDLGIKSIGVLWGLNDRETLSMGNPTRIIENPADLLGAIEDVLK